MRAPPSASALLHAAAAPRVSFVPPSPPPSLASVSALSDFVASSQRLCVLTGAGLSTESGLQDYRSPGVGAYSVGHKPMTHRAFVSDEHSRKRYWARSFLGWPRWSKTQPNVGHAALASLAAAGRLSSCITQNVDRLHHKSGHVGRLIELHGTTHVVGCLSCGAETCREELQSRLQAENASWSVPEPSANEFRPDGDREVSDEALAAFRVVRCVSCGGDLKPTVVFFGDSLPSGVAADAQRCVDDADALLVVGSSLSTRSAYRLVTSAADRGLPVALLTLGESRADHLATLRVQARAGETLQRVLAHGGLDLPPLTIRW